jgi:NADH-quinone oxidoreductase subunit C
LDEGNERLLHLREHLSDCLVSAEEVDGELRLEVTPEGLLAICETLRDNPLFGFDYPADLTAYDTGEKFILWYRLHSMSRNQTAILHVSVSREEAFIPSVSYIWPGMSWHERESFDLFGIRFPGHPDQEDSTRMRILLPEDWEGHPFRKDYVPIFSGNPLHGPQETN